MFVRGKKEISRTRARCLLEGRKKSRGRVRAVCYREGRNFEDACALFVRGKEEISRTSSRCLLEGRKKSRGRVRAVGVNGACHAGYPFFDIAKCSVAAVY